MCTGVRIGAKNGDVVYARTMEFGTDMQSKIIMIPRNYACAGFIDTHQKGLEWRSKYAVVGANAFSEVEVLDGINEAGLAGGLFYFPEYAQYQEIDAKQYAQSIAPWQLLTWILTNFSTVAQVKEALPRIRVINTIFKPWGIVPPIHGVVHDAKECMVIEYVQGMLRVHENSLGVCTNAPAFDWHTTNLTNYVNLSPKNCEQLLLGGLTLKPLSAGSGMHGLPGDFTSPSRFVRATFLSQAILQASDAAQARDNAFRVLDSFMIAKGVVGEQEKGVMEYEYTQWTTASDLKNKHYYFHTYEDRALHKIDVMQLDVQAKEPLMLPMSVKQTIVQKLVSYETF